MPLVKGQEDARQMESPSSLEFCHSAQSAVCLSVASHSGLQVSLCGGSYRPAAVAMARVRHSWKIEPALHASHFSVWCHSTTFIYVRICSVFLSHKKRKKDCHIGVNLHFYAKTLDIVQLQISSFWFKNAMKKSTFVEWGFSSYKYWN